MSLSTDLVDYILSFLQSDLVTLKTCAQSHPTLSKLSERYIYANVTLHDDLDTLDPLKLEGLRTSEFTQILAKRPDIANHVRGLSVRVISAWDSGEFEEFEATSSHLNSVASLLPTLSGLTKLAIRGDYQSWLPFSWHTLPEAFHQAFLHFLHAQFMKDVFIYNAEFFPLSLLNNCRNVRATLDSCEETRYDSEKSTEDMLLSCPGTFEHLTIRHCSPTCLKNIIGWMQIHSLRSLKFKGESRRSPTSSYRLFELIDELVSGLL